MWCWIQVGDASINICLIYHRDRWRDLEIIIDMYVCMHQDTYIHFLAPSTRRTKK